jgi:hypothetical protein
MPLFKVIVSLRGRCEIDVYAKDARAAEDEIHRMSIDRLTEKCEFGNGISVEDVKMVPASQANSVSTESDLD